MTAPSPTQVVLEYDVDTTGTLTNAALDSALAAVILPTGDVSQIGLTLTNDTHNTTVSGAQRLLTFSTLPPFSALSVLPAPGTFQGSIVSSSPNDAANGTGAQQFRIDYLDQQGLPQYELVVPNGTTPVNLNSKTKVQVTAITPTKVGSLGAPDGLINVYSGLNGTGLLTGQVLNNFQGSIVSSSPDDNASGVGAQVIRVTYHDKNGAGPFTENISPTGRTPANFVNIDHAVIDNIELVSVGVTGSSTGIISIMSGVNGTGSLVAFLGQSFFQFFPQQTVVAATLKSDGNEDGTSAPNAGQTIAADVGAPLRGIYTHIIGAALVSKVTAVEPAFS